MAVAVVRGVGTSRQPHIKVRGSSTMCGTYLPAHHVGQTTVHQGQSLKDALGTGQPCVQGCNGLDDPRAVHHRQRLQGHTVDQGTCTRAPGVGVVVGWGRGEVQGCRGDRARHSSRHSSGTPFARCVEISMLQKRHAADTAWSPVRLTPSHLSPGGYNVLTEEVSHV
jgi:hypothetical protein